MNWKVAVSILAMISLLFFVMCHTSPSDATETVPDGTVYTYETHGSGHPNYYCTITDVESDRELVYVPAVLEGYDVREIRSHAFDGCGMKEVVIPAGVRSIGADSFTGCSKLKDVYLLGDRPDMDGAFQNDVVLHVIPGKTGWGEEEAITTAHGYDIDYALMPDGWMVTGGMSTSGSLDIKDAFAGYQVTSIAPYAFAGTMQSDGEVERRSDIVSVTLPESIISIRERAFYYCDIESIALPSSLRYIHDEAFRAGEKLDVLELNDGLEFIGFECFRECDSIGSIRIPDTVVHAGEGCIKWCESLKEADVGVGLGSIPSEMFFYCTALESIKLKDGIIEIGSQAFSNCRALKEIVIPDSVETLDTDSFRYCISLSKADLGRVQSIGTSAFMECTSLGSFDLPDTVREMGPYCFADCGELGIRAYGICPNVSGTSFQNDDVTIHCYDRYRDSWDSIRGADVIADLDKDAGPSAWMIPVVAVAIMVAILAAWFILRSKPGS